MKQTQPQTLISGKEENSKAHNSSQRHRSLRLRCIRPWQRSMLVLMLTGHELIEWNKTDTRPLAEQPATESTPSTEKALAYKHSVMVPLGQH